MRNPYLILGVSGDAPDYVIQAAFRACLKRFHPDQYSGSDASSKTAEIVAAYDTLRDPLKRRALDEQLNRTDRSDRKTPPPPPPREPPPKTSQRSDPESQVPRKSNWQSLAAVATAGVILYVLFNSGQKDDPNMLAFDTATTGVLADTVEIPATEVLLGAEEAASAAEDAAESIEVETSGELPYQAEAVSFSNVEAASRRFFAVLQKDGMMGARRTSEHCHNEQTKTPTWQGLDYCAAFDFAADMMDRGFSSRGGARNAYFKFQSENQSDYYSGRYTFTRLQAIRSASETALSESMEGYLRKARADQAEATATSDAEPPDLDADLSVNHQDEDSVDN